MIKIKPNACILIRGVRPEIVFALVVAEKIYASIGVDLVITSVCDGKHSWGSLHFQGAAVDIRTNNVPESKQQFVRDLISEALDEEFDVVLESDHIHVEFQPKK